MDFQVAEVGARIIQGVFLKCVFTLRSSVLAHCRRAHAHSYTQLRGAAAPPRDFCKVSKNGVGRIARTPRIKVHVRAAPRRAHRAATRLKRSFEARRSCDKIVRVIFDRQSSGKIVWAIFEVRVPEYGAILRRRVGVAGSRGRLFWKKNRRDVFKKKFLITV